MYTCGKSTHNIYDAAEHACRTSDRTYILADLRADIKHRLYSEIAACRSMLGMSIAICICAMIDEDVATCSEREDRDTNTDSKWRTVAKHSRESRRFGSCDSTAQ